MLDNSARETATHLFLQMKTSVALDRMPLSAAVGENAWRDSVSVRDESTQKRDTAGDTASAATLTVHTKTAGIYEKINKPWNINFPFNPDLLQKLRLKRQKLYPTVYAEAVGSVSVENAFVMMTGLVRTAAAPWKLLPVWPQIRICVAIKGCVSVGNVFVSHHTQARPVRTALCVMAHVGSMWTVWNVGRSGRGRRRTGENQGHNVN